jgi:glycosyltransferase involved in cell wall biosynthesis
MSFRILLFAEYDEAGGTRTYLKKLIDFYSRNKFQLYVIGLGPNNENEILEYCKSINVIYFDYLQVFKKVFRKRNIIYRLFCEILNSHKLFDFKSFDLLVASVGNPGLFLGHLTLAKKSVYIIHTSPEVPLKISVFKRYINRLFWRFSIPKSCNLVSVSRYAISKMIDNWGLSKNQYPSLIYNTSSDIICFNQKENDRLSVLTVGHAVGYKNPFFWIDVANCVIKENPRACFTWVGPGILLDDCKSKVAKMGLIDSVKFVGLKKDMNEYYYDCDVYFQPSLIESFGLSVLDAMRFGKPSVVSDVGGLPELIKNNQSGFVLDLQSGVDYFAKKILYLLSNNSARMTMGQYAQRDYLDRFSPQRWENEMFALHNKIFNQLV